MGATTKLFEEIQEKGHRVYISPLVIVEIDRTKDKERQTNLRKLINEYEPELLEDMPQVRSLAEKYLSAKIVPRNMKLTQLILRLLPFMRWMLS